MCKKALLQLPGLKRSLLPIISFIPTQVPTSLLYDTSWSNTHWANARRHSGIPSSRYYFKYYIVVIWLLNQNIWTPLYVFTKCPSDYKLSFLTVKQENEAKRNTTKAGNSTNMLDGSTASDAGASGSNLPIIKTRTENVHERIGFNPVPRNT